MKERIITALVLMALITTVVFFIPSLFIPLVAVVLAISIWEWCKISIIRRPMSYFVAAAAILLWIAACCYPSVLNVLLIISMLHYIYTVRLIYQYETIHNNSIRRTYLTIVGPFLLASLAAVLVYIFHPTEETPSVEEAMSLIYIVLLIAAADSGAYFIGRFFGKKKMAPRVSPKKTIEGLMGGIVSALIIAFSCQFMIEGLFLSSIQIFFIALITVLFSVIGDLFISIIKRQNNIKDSSQILPGHGGILDRIDGLLAGIPIFYLLQQFV
ncbi:MAG: phosphatidate cytidylyltransferase [Gammaproteobacteria bacterium]|nr:phosphatidate cytidylyltransferase [Gammaproteobacteria bacterium]